MSFTKLLHGLTISAMLFVASNAFGQQTDEVTLCYEKIERDDSLSAIKSKVTIALANPTAEMLTNNSKPTKNEKIAISKWMDMYSQCANTWTRINEANHLHPTLLKINRESFLYKLTLTSDLYAGKLTYGEFAKARMTALSSRQNEWQEAVKKIQDDDRAIAQAEQMRIQKIQNQNAQLQLQQQQLQQQAEWQAQQSRMQGQQQFNEIMNNAITNSANQPIDPYAATRRQPINTVCGRNMFGQVVYSTQ